MQPRIGYAEAAAYLGLKPGTLRALVSRGQIPHIRISARLVLFEVVALDRFLDEKRVGTR